MDLLESCQLGNNEDLSRGTRRNRRDSLCLERLVCLAASSTASLLVIPRHLSWSSSVLARAGSSVTVIRALGFTLGMFASV
jgi:hypothetical protein